MLKGKLSTHYGYPFFHFALKKIVYFWLCWVFTAVCRLSLVAVSGGLLFTVVWGLLIVEASFVGEHGLLAPGLQ